MTYWIQAATGFIGPFRCRPYADAIARALDAVVLTRSEDWRPPA